MNRYILWVSAGLGLALAACYDQPTPAEPPPGSAAAGTATTEVATIPGHEGLAIDTHPKQGARILPGEVYLRSYQMLFGGISPTEIARVARGTDRTELFDTWSNALGALGLPSYADDIDRTPGTNALMLASYERLGIALCDRAVEHDLRGQSPRWVFDFALAADPNEPTGFGTRFDSLHRTFLGYPAALAAGRTDRFRALYTEVLQRHSAAGAPTSAFQPAEAAWAVVCYGLVRHPELHLY